MIEHIVVSIIVVLSIIFPTILDGVERKIKARIHSRIGPPILQSWYDIIKLFGKEQVMPRNSLHAVMLLILLTITQVFLIVYTSVSIIFQITQFDIVVIIALFIILQTIFISIPLTIPNTFSVLGGSREIALTLVNEALFIVIMGFFIYYTGITSFKQLTQLSPTVYLLILLLALFITGYVSSGRIPFDIAEAEPELASGLMIEFSGPILGVFLLTFHIRRFFVKFFPSILFLGLFIHTPISLIIAGFITTIILWIIYAVIAAILGRSRVDLAPITLLKIYLVLIALSIIGYYLKV